MTTLSQESMYKFVVSTVAVGGLAPFGARPSADTVITKIWCHIHGLVQERRNSIANTLELHLSWTNPLIYEWYPAKRALPAMLTHGR